MCVYTFQSKNLITSVFFLDNNCTFYSLDRGTLETCDKFSCGHEDLDDFFNNKSYLYNDELLGKSYCFRLNDDPKKIVCAFTVSNAHIKNSALPNNRGKKIKKDIPHEKHSDSFPAVLIGRLGVSQEFQGQDIGDELMDFIKAWFIDPHNKTGCRFIVVDAYNEKIPLNYYEDNDFKYIFSSEEQEAESINKPTEDSLKTRLMYFDLIVLKPA